MQQQDLTRVEWEIINYLRENPGSSKANIIRHMRDIQLASRMTVLEYVKDLETKNIIYGKKERPNSQIIMMYVNEENELVSVLTELEKFKEAYIKLLEKSKEIMDNKDYSTEVLRITERDPAKWSDADKDRYLSYEYDKVIQQYDIYSKILMSSRKLKQQIDYDGNLRDKKLELDRQQYHDKLVQYMDESTQVLKELRAILKTEREISKSLSGGVYHMIFGPIALFYSMADIIFYRSMFTWPNDNNNDNDNKEDTLPQMYSIVYKKILEIQFKLSEFVRSIKFRFDYNQIMMSGRDNKLLEFSLGALIDLYRRANMGSEIQQVVNSLINLNKEVKGLKLLGAETLYDSLDDMVEELIRKEEATENYIKKGMEGLQTNKEEQIGHSNESVVKELERKLLDQGTHFRMFEIMDVERVLRKLKPDEKLIEFELYLPGIEFPLDRNKMIDYAEREFLDRDAFLLNIFQSLDAEAYETKESLEHVLTSLFKTSRKDFFGKNQTFDHVTIYTNKEEISEHQKSIDKRVTTEH